VDITLLLERERILDILCEKSSYARLGNGVNAMLGLHPNNLVIILLLLVVARRGDGGYRAPADASNGRLPPSIR
jgi:hypothetical protein